MIFSFWVPQWHLADFLRKEDIGLDNPLTWSTRALVRWAMVPSGILGPDSLYSVLPSSA